MTSVMTVVSVNEAIEDIYPLPGTRIKQWVVDMQREDAWVEATCPTVLVPEHQGDDGDTCPMDGATRWSDLQHVACERCNFIWIAARSTPPVAEWLAVKAARPPIEADRSKLSADIAPPWPELRDHPMLAMLRKP